MTSSDAVFICRLQVSRNWRYQVCSLLSLYSPIRRFLNATKYTCTIHDKPTVVPKYCKVRFLCVSCHVRGLIKNEWLNVVSDFRREVNENCALMGYYAACSGNSLSSFRNNLSVLIWILALEEGTDTFSRNIVKELPLHAELKAREAHFPTSDWNVCNGKTCGLACVHIKFLCEIFEGNRIILRSVLALQAVVQGGTCEMRSRPKWQCVSGRTARRWNDIF